VRQAAAQSVEFEANDYVQPSPADVPHQFVESLAGEFGAADDIRKL